MACLTLLIFVVTLSSIRAMASNPSSCLHRHGGSTAALAARACDDAPSHPSEDCDPCDEDCILSKGNDGHELEVRTVHGNFSIPWEEDEAARFHIISARQNPQAVFNCRAIPEVCQNMCFGIDFIRRTVGAQWPATLTKNTGKRGTSQYNACTAARAKNLCAREKTNRCSASYRGHIRFQKRSGLSCDEYPFASTREGQKANPQHKAVTRCVPARQNSAQGGKISQLYRHVNNHDEFDVRFDFGQGAAEAGHAGGVGYCAPPTATLQSHCNIANDHVQEEE